MGILWTIVGIIAGIILVVILYKVLKALIHIIPEGQRLIVYRLGRFNRVVGPGLVLIVPGLEQVARTMEMRDHPLEVEVTGIFAYGVPNDLTLDLWCSFDLIKAAGGNKAKLSQLVQINEAERRKQVEVKMREALVGQITELQNRLPLPNTATPLDAVIALAPGTERYDALIEGVEKELAHSLPSIGVILNSTQPITLTGRGIPDSIIEAIKRMQGRQIDSQWLTKYADQLRQQFPDISSVVLDQMLASIDGVDVGNVQRLRLEQDDKTEAQVDIEMPMDGSNLPRILAKPKIKVPETEIKHRAVEPQDSQVSPQLADTHLTKSDLTVLKRIPRPDEREQQRRSA